MVLLMIIIIIKFVKPLPDITADNLKIRLYASIQERFDSTGRRPDAPDSFGIQAWISPKSGTSKA